MILQEQAEADSEQRLKELQEQAEAESKIRWANYKRAMAIPRHNRGEPQRRGRKQAVSSPLGEGYADLPTQEGWIATDTGFVMASLDYSKLFKIAMSFAHKAKVQDQQDLLHDIIEGLAHATKHRLATGQDFTEPAMVRTAEHIKDRYWYRRYAYYHGLDCKHCSKEQKAKCEYNWAHTEWAYTDCHRAIQLESLNQPVTDKEGNVTELGNLLIDDKALDLEAWIDAKVWLIGAPIRLKAIAMKRNSGETLSVAERKYLVKLRKREQKALL